MIVQMFSLLKVLAFKLLDGYKTSSKSMAAIFKQVLPQN